MEGEPARGLRAPRLHGHPGGNPPCERRSEGTNEGALGTPLFLGWMCCTGVKVMWCPGIFPPMLLWCWRRGRWFHVCVREATAHSFLTVRGRSLAAHHAALGGRRREDARRTGPWVPVSSGMGLMTVWGDQKRRAPATVCQGYRWLGDAETLCLITGTLSREVPAGRRWPSFVRS